MVVQWFPGHMARARRVLEENLKLVDIVVELADARLPFSSRNPEIDRILGNKPRVIVFNKADLADPAVSSYWMNYYRGKGIHTVFTDCRTGDGVKKVIDEITAAMADKVARLLEKGRREPVIHAMIVGIPNVGKSSFINRVAGKAVAVTGDKPGVTRNKQWLKMNKDIFLLDTPGLLWPKIENQRSAVKLACSGAIKDDILDTGELAAFLLCYIEEHYTEALTERFKIDLEKIDAESDEYAEADYMTESIIGNDVIRRGTLLLEACGRKRGCLLKGGEVDYNRAAALVLDDFRAGKLGRISLDLPEVLKEEEALQARLAEEALNNPKKKKKKGKK